jgi:hypothetical protein
VVEVFDQGRRAHPVRLTEGQGIRQSRAAAARPAGGCAREPSSRASACRTRDSGGTWRRHHSSRCSRAQRRDRRSSSTWRTLQGNVRTCRKRNASLHRECLRADSGRNLRKHV